ncbi:hypothetical protein ACIRN4_16375 [Pimelobacter simplex]|uniref:phage tail protein n=1 Tax=Nocardioides simplex TaxID=2045 RepID=UPI0037FE0E87
MASTDVIFDVIGRDHASSTFDKVGDSANRSGGKMAKFGKIAKVAALGVAGGVAAAGVALFKLGQGAAEDAAGQARLAKALKNSAGATKAQTASVEDWISKQGVALGVADDELRPALEKLAVATKDVGKAQKLATLGMDVAAGTGLSLQAVSKALAKAQNGQVAGLSKLGISTKDAEGKTISFAEAQKRLAKAHGGQAATSANTLQGKIGRLKLILSETGETIGSKLLPVATQLADWFLKDGLPKISAFGNYLSTVLPPIVEKVKTVVSAVLGAMKGDVSGNLGGIKQIFTDAVSIIRSLWNAFGPTLLASLKSSFENMKMMLSGAFTIIRGIFATVSALLKGDWKGVWEGIKTILRGAATLLVGLVRELWNKIKLAFSSAGIAVKAIFSGLWNGIRSAASAGLNWLVERVRSIPGSLKGLGGKFLEAGKTLIGKLWDGIKNAAGNAGGFVGDLLGKVKSGINSLLRLPLKTPEIKVKGIKILGSTTIIPAFARGGIAPGGTALVGEEGPELVDLPRGSRVTPHRASMARLGGGGTVEVHLHMGSGFVGDESKLATALEQMFLRYVRSTGRPLQFKTAAA